MSVVMSLFKCSPTHREIATIASLSSLKNVCLLLRLLHDTTLRINLEEELVT